MSCSLTTGIDDLNVDQENVLRGVVITSALLSLLGSAFIILSYALFSELRTIVYRLIVFLSVADFFASLSYLVSAVADSPRSCPGFTCYLTAVMSQYFEVSTFLWTACIAFNIHQVLARGATSEASAAYEKYFHMLCWGVPALFAIIAGAAGAYGPAGNWCWIKEDAAWARFTLFYMPLVVIFVYNAAVLYLSARAARGRDDAKTVAFRLRLYVLVFFGCRIFAVVNRTQNFIAPASPVFALYLLQSITDPIQGLGNALVYGLNRMVVSAYRSWMQSARCCRCFRPAIVEQPDPSAL